MTTKRGLILLQHSLQWMLAGDNVAFLPLCLCGANDHQHGEGYFIGL